MADESQYSSGTETTPHKRKYEDPSLSQSATHRSTGFSAPIASPSPDSARAPLPSYNSVPPPAASGIELAKQRAQEVAARLLNTVGSGAGGLDAKRPKVDNGATGFDSIDAKPQYSALSNAPPSYAYQGTSKKIDIPNGRVGVIIGKGGETIKYLQTQSGAKIQVTRDMDADPNSSTRMVELMGTPDQIAMAEKLINEVLAEAAAGGSGVIARQLTGQAGSEQFVMKIPNNKVGLVIGKGGETIKNMQTQSGARIQVIPLHLPPGDTSTERTVQIDGTGEQIEAAKQLVNQVTSENHLRNPSMSGGYPQLGYQAQPPSSWVPPGVPMQPPGYGYVQPGAYSGQSSQYNMSQQQYPGYPQTSGGYSTNWDQSTVPPSQQSSQGAGYDYYSQQPRQNPGIPAPQSDGTAYNYSQPPSAGYTQPGQGYAQDGYSGYHAPTHLGYGQPPTYDQQQGYNTASSYGSGSNPAQDGHTPNYGSHGDSAQAPPPVQPSSGNQQGYRNGTNQQPSPGPANYPPQGTAHPGYGMPPTTQAAYGNQPPAVLSGYGAPQAQKSSGTPVYGQSTQSPSTAGGYGQPGALQPGYTSHPPPSGHAQPESGPERPPSGFGAAVQPGYGPPVYGATPGGQPGYGQAPSYSSSSYGSGYAQPPVYSSDGNAGGNARGNYDGAPAQAVQQGGDAKVSPQS